ncbi:MAG: serine hydrolase, partial [Bacteroidetes bacterium]|nr:serine hydrolase [Bacteroidota bacterium]
LLKNEFGFKGLIVTDALEMKGVTKIINIDEAAIRAVEAGVDILLLPPDEDAAIDAIRDAVRKGRISERRIDSSVAKILAIKQWLKLDENRLVNVNKIPEIVSKPEHWNISKEIAQASITVVKNDNLIPVSWKKKIAVIIVSDADDYRTDINRSSNASPNEKAGDYLLSQIRTRRSGVQTIRLSPRSNKIDFGTATSLARAADVVVFALYAKTRTRANPYGIPQNLIDFINSLTNGSSASTNYRSIILSFGNPYVVGTIKNPNTVMCTFSDGELSTEAAVEVLFGETEAKGRLPVTIPPMYAFGSGIVVAKSALHDEKAEATFSESKFVKVSKVIQKAIQDNAFPGAQLVVVKKGKILLNKNFGTLDYSPNAKEITDSTLYDIASLTKVVGTTSAIMKLYDEGKINLDEKVVTYVPEFGNSGKDKITVRNLLLHNSGLPAWQKFYLTCNTSSEVLDSIYNSKLIYKTGDSTVYSDFGFIVLGKIIEKITGFPLDIYLKNEFFEPLGMQNTFYNPSSDILQRVAPTEFDTVWRKKLVQGAVHDETAALLGGVSGHAGLFSTATDLAIFVQMILNGGSYGGVQYIKPEPIKLFTERPNMKMQRGLGWDFKTLNGYSSAGNLFGQKSFGHTGFTGTSIWVDPERNLFVIFLTNRVHPTRANTKISKLRSDLHDAVIESIINDQ